MGSYNIVTASVRCPRCRSSVDVRVQFKFGDTWQHEYRPGDRLRWGGNDVGAPGKRHVVVDGVSEAPCPVCGYGNEWSFYVHVRNDVIDKVEPATGEHDFVKEGATILVLEE
jgi:endogenous inhibitor of DNA gyrase (YacG/DUF329 family)